MTVNTLVADDAVEILRTNDFGGYTVPTRGLYPFQWNWDAGFTALGWLKVDEARAWKELELLFAGQWPNGLVPSIVFHQASDTYFPGPDEWGTSHHPPTTAISQPPVIATIMRILYTECEDRALAQKMLEQMMPNIIAHHRWWFNDRDPENTGMVVSYHPWESGMDNSPAWDLVLERVPRVTRSYQRKDLGHVDSEQRPHHEQYDRYIYLVDLFKSLNFDPLEIYKQCPYKVQDIALNSILARANKDLLYLCEITDHADSIDYFSAKQMALEAAIDTRWDDELQVYLSKDCKTNELIRVKTTAGLLPVYAGCLPTDKEQIVIEVLKEWIAAAPFGLSSCHHQESGYDPKRYWRGPTWPHVNWMIASGLDIYNQHDLSERLRVMTGDVIAKAGYWEYFHPELGEGYGGNYFSWTAAMVLYWVLAENKSVD